MVDKLKLKAEIRKVLGRKVKTLRKEGLIPANIFGKKVDSLAVSINLKEFETLFKEAGETSLVNLEIGKDSRSVLVRNIQVHPVDSSILHVDFQEVNLKEKIEAQVPVEIVGEAPAEKQGLGTLVQQMDEIKVEALPTDLPEKFEVNVDGLTEVNQSIFVKDIKVDSSKVEIKDDGELIVVKVDELAKEEVIEPVVTEGEAVSGEAKPEGEQKTEESTDSKPSAE